MTEQARLTRRRSEHVPGEAGIWVFVLADMTVFVLFFGTFLHDRAHEPELFAASQTELTAGFGIVNTLVLLTSSLFVALGVQGVRHGHDAAASRLFGGALVCAFVFMGSKAIEYSDKLSSGLTPGTNSFFMYFYVVTAIHLLHVVIGTLILIYLRRRAGASPDNRGHAAFESGATYWHMVDLLWVVIFPLFYLTSA
ncbi:MAG: cytochrome c oxidase subunit 3 family protein [Woeseiaceae bacterium]